MLLMPSQEVKIDSKYGKFKPKEVPYQFLSIFEHAQGDPGDTEMLLVRAYCAYHPNRKIQRVGEFTHLLEAPTDVLTSRRTRHPEIIHRGDISDSIERLHERLITTYDKRFRANVSGEQLETIDDLIPALAQEIVCRDWLYLIHDNGRPKPGIQPGRPYDPNEDKWFSYIAYYALWKDSNGKRHTTGSDFFNVLYEKIGDYLERSTENLGIDESYKDLGGNPDGQAIEDKLMEAIRVYNEQQKMLGRTNQCVWEERIDEYFSGEDEIEVILL